MSRRFSIIVMSVDLNTLARQLGTCNLSISYRTNVPQFHFLIEKQNIHQGNMKVSDVFVAAAQETLLQVVGGGRRNREKTTEVQLIKPEKKRWESPFSQVTPEPKM